MTNSLCATGRSAFIRALLFVTTFACAAMGWSQDELQMDGMGNIAHDAAASKSPAALLYKAHCAQCHDNPIGRIPPRASLRYRPAEGVYEALVSGVMKPMAAGLSDDEKKSIVKLLTGREPKSIPNPNDFLCSRAADSAVVGEGDWASTQGDNEGRRYRVFSELNVKTVDRLLLKWTYAYPGGAKGPATIAGDSLFLAGTGYVIALDKNSGCVQWAYPAAGRTVRAVTVANTSKAGNLPASLALFGDDSNTVFAVDATTGSKLWQTTVDDHVLGRITAAPTVHDGVVYVPLSSMEDPLTHDKSYFCCSARGGVAAVDLHTGKLLWKQKHISQTLNKIDDSGEQEGAYSKEQGAGYFQQGPAGASTYTPLTIDTRRGLVYATTAEEYGFTGASGPYSVVAYDLKTGKRAWQQSLLPSPAERSRICATRETDCRNMFSTGTSALIHPLSEGKDIIVVGQKSGMVHGLDPDDGSLLWSTRVSEGGDLGGVMYGLASDDKKIYVPISDVDSPESRFTGSLVALDPATGIIVWRTPAPKPACSWDTKHCIGGQVAAVTVVSDMVFTGFWDGFLRIYAAEDGRLLREIDTAKEYPAVNGVASGGQVSGYPVTVGKDALYINSGASSIMKSGNALLVYTLDGK